MWEVGIGGERLEGFASHTRVSGCGHDGGGGMFNGLVGSAWVRSMVMDVGGKVEIWAAVVLDHMKAKKFEFNPTQIPRHDRRAQGS